MNNLQQLKLLVFLAALMTGAWFYSPGTWNAASRYDSIYTLVEEGTFAIDTYITNPKKNINTGDWAYHDGHYYSSKAPGNMFAGAAAYAPLYWGGRLLGIEHSPRIDLFYGWWINFWCSAVPLALGTLCLLLLLLEWDFTPIRAVFWSLCFAAATPMFPYSTQLWGHPMAASFVAIAFYAAWKRKPSHILAGLAAGIAVLADYAAAFALPALALPLLAHKDWRGILKTILGGISPLALFLWYHWACFGSPVTIANAYANPVFLQSEGAGGMMTRFSTLTAWKLLFGTQRGLLWNAPLLILAFPGARALWREKRCITIGLAFTILAGLLSNAAYGFWDGGASVTARFLIYSLPAWILFAAHWRTPTTGRQLTAIFLAAWSFLNMFTVANISPIISTLRYSPLIPDAYWMCYCDGAWNRNRSKGLRLYNWQKETKKFSKEAAISPGRSLIGYAPWSDIILFATAAAILYRTLLHRHLDTAARMKKWRNDLADAFKKHGHRLKNPWLYATAAAIMLMVLFPGTTVWDRIQHEMVVVPLQELLVEKWASGGRPALWFYQILLSWYPSPIAVLLLKAIITAGLTAFAVTRIARIMNLPALPCVAMALLFPAWLFHNRTITETPLLVPMLLLAISGILGMVEGPPEKTRSNLLWAMAGGIPAFWDAPGSWAIIYLITFTILLVPHLRHRFYKVTLFFLIPVQMLLMGIQFAYTADHPRHLLFGTELQDLIATGHFKTVAAISLGTLLLLAILCLKELKNLDYEVVSLIFCCIASVCTGITIFTGRNNAESSHAVAMLTTFLFTIALPAVNRFKFLWGACVIASLCLCTVIIAVNTCKSTRNTTSLAEQWRAAKYISRLEDQGHETSIKYYTTSKEGLNSDIVEIPTEPTPEMDPEEFINPQSFEYLIEMAYIVRPYDQIKIPRPELEPLLIKIQKDPHSTKLKIETINQLENIFSLPNYRK